MDNINQNDTNSGTNVSPATVVSGNNNDISISSIIQDNSGGVSSTRVLMLAWGLIPLIIWSAGAIVALYHGIYIFPTISPEVVTIMLGITGAKVVQRFGEK